MRISSLGCLLVVLVAVAPATVVGANAEDVQRRTIRFGHLNNRDHPVSAGVRKFSALVATKSGGKILVKEYPSNQLGTEQQQTQALRAGTQEMQSPATTSIVELVKELGVLDFPFSVSTYQQGFALVDGPLGDALVRRLPDKGLVALAFWDLGFRNMTNGIRPIERLEDFRDLKLRVIPNPVFMESFKRLNAHPVPLSFRDLYAALEIKAVDGQENPFNVIRSNRFFEVQKYVSATNHVYAANVILISGVFWNRLSSTEQRILREAALEARDYQRKVSVRAAQDAVQSLIQAGMRYNEISLSERERMRKAVQPVIDRFVESYDEEFRDLYRSEIVRVLQIR